MTILLLSRGVPLLLGGDEMQRTQGGNNNAYNQDNPTSWFDWTTSDSKTEMQRYFQGMIAFRKRTPLWQPRFYTGAPNERGPGRHHVARDDAGQPGVLTIRRVGRWRARSLEWPGRRTCTS